MSEKSRYPNWFLWLAEKGPLAWMAAVAIPIVGLMIVAIYLDARLEDIEGRLDYRLSKPEAGYEKIDLPENVATGQQIYVPVYSHIYYRGGQPYLLETTLSVRNTDPTYPIVIRTVDYYDTKGNLVNHYLEKPLRLPPLATTEFLVEQADKAGGSGANFVVEWVAEDEVNGPLVEAVMVGTAGTQGISFARSGTPIFHTVPKATD